MRAHLQEESCYAAAMQRMTNQRRAILAALKHAGRPMGPEELLAAAREDVPSLNLATVYRNLNAMYDRQEVARVEMFGQPPRYELAGLDHHHHFLCEECDRVYDIPGCPELPKKLAPRGFQVTGHEFTLFGRCRSCV